MNERPKVLLAHTSEELKTLLGMMLEDDFAMTCCADSNEALSKAQEIAFDFVLLDTELAPIDGQQLCEKIRALSGDRRLPVIFISENTDDDVIKQAYDLGAFDYICMPFNVLAFHQHFVRFAQEVNHLNEVEQQDKAFIGVAETAMKQAAFYGQGLELVASLNHCTDYAQLGHIIGTSLKALGINCATQFRINDFEQAYDADGQPCSEIENQIFRLLKDQGRIYHFGRRSIFNDQHVSVLVKTMPVKDTPTYDAVLDMVAKLVPALDARVVALQQYQMLAGARSAMLAMIEAVNHSLDELNKEKLDFINHISTKIGLSFHELDLQEHQEQFFLNLIEKELKGKLSSDKLLSLKAMITECIAGVEIEEPTSISQDAATANTQDIELF